MKKNIGQLASEIYALLEGQEKEESIKILSSVSTLLGIGTIPPTSGLNSNGTPDTSMSNNQNTQTHIKNAKAFFDLKDPKTKGEEFAVAAKYRAEHGLGESHTKEDFKTIIKTQAKRKFDESNFARDIDNTIRQAKFFLKDDGKGQYMLSDVGEKYVDALPDRSAAHALRKGKSGTKKGKKSTRKKSIKK